MSPYSFPGLGPLAWIDVVLLGWFGVVAISLVYIAWDVFTNTPEATVIKWAWVLTTLYMGPVAVALYILADKEPRPGEHERFIAPMWKQALGSTLHCVAGDATGIILAAAGYANLGIGSDDVRGVVMPPGMINARDLPAEAMRDVAAVVPDDVSYTAPADARGDQLLQPRIEDGVKVFDLETSVIKWNILPNEQVMAYAFNRQVPGPRIRVTEGDRLRINVTNHLPESTTVHWHGLILPNAMDGPAEITQQPIEPGETYTYEFVVQQHGTFFYHSHDHVDRQQTLGLYGALIIDPQDPALDAAYDYDHELVVQLQEWLEREGYTFPAMTMDGALPNFFTINGKAYPATETVKMRVGEKLRVRFIGSNAVSIHPMHIHGGPFQVVEVDGQAVPEAARIYQDTVNVGPGQRFDVIWEAREPGKWLLHCHITHHTTNDNVEHEGGGGLMLIIEVEGTAS